MDLNFEQNWPVYILLGLVAWFVVYVIISGNKQEKIDKQDKGKPE